MNNIVKNALVNSVGTLLYVILIATFFYFAETLFGQNGEEDKVFLIPVVMLLLLILSAAITGSLVFGRPILWYLDGRKKEALSLLLYTFGFIALIIVISLVALYSIVSSG